MGPPGWGGLSVQGGGVFVATATEERQQGGVLLLADAGGLRDPGGVAPRGADVRLAPGGPACQATDRQPELRVAPGTVAAEQRSDRPIGQPARRWLCREHQPVGRRRPNRLAANEERRCAVCRTYGPQPSACRGS